MKIILDGGPFDGLPVEVADTTSELVLPDVTFTTSSGVTYVYTDETRDGRVVFRRLVEKG
jgi:hypothetical protein